MEKYQKKKEAFRHYHQGSLGRAIADCLDENGLSFVPGFESHDLKHVLLGYQMRPVGEIRLQAYMLGNGNITAPSVLIFYSG